MDSILDTIKDMLDIEPTFDGFDNEIIVHINSALMSLHQLGIGPEDGLAISDDTAVWADLFDGLSNIEAVKSYIWLNVRLLWDPPGTSFLVESINKQIETYAWRLTVQVDELSA
jgi:hypothetical protein